MKTINNFLNKLVEYSIKFIVACIFIWAGIMVLSLIWQGVLVMKSYVN